MKITAEMMAKIEKCKSAEEIMELAKGYNVVINMKQAQDAFDMLKLENVSDEMLEKVCGGRPPRPVVPWDDDDSRK